MILCLFGTNPYEFTRLAIALDNIATNFSQKFFIQSGYTTYSFKNCESVSFLPHEELLEKIKASSVVICQGGYGSIIDSIENNIPTISIPRYPKLNESADEQSETVKRFYEDNLIEACFENLFDLEDKVKRLLSRELVLNNYHDFLSNRSELSIKNIISNFIDDINI